MAVKTALIAIPARGAQFPFYLWLVGIYPILFLYATNLGSVLEQDVIAAIGGMLLATSAAYALANRLLRDRHKSAFVLAICSLVFSLSGHVYSQAFMPRSLGVWTVGELLLLAVAVVWLCRQQSRRFFVYATYAFNPILACLIVYQGIDIVPELIKRTEYANQITSFVQEKWPTDAAEKVQDSPSRPDIYFIVPDGYPSDDWLKEVMDYDNSSFTEEMRQRGFVVVDHAQSNYGITHLSLASRLNTRYYPANTSFLRDEDYLELEIATSEIARYLLSLGYTYIHFNSEIQLPSPIADINKEFSPRGTSNFHIGIAGYPRSDRSALSDYPITTRRLDGLEKRQFTSFYIDTTVLRLARSLLDRVRQSVDDTTPYKWDSPELFLASLDEVKEVVAMPEATFTYIHLLKPHLPTVFGADGQILGLNKTPSPPEFFAELHYLNARFLETFDYVVAHSQHPPIIIFMADHGSTYGHYGAQRGCKFEWAPACDVSLTHFDVYAAIYLPRAYSIDIPKPFTAINTFPLILNEVFSTQLALVEDRLFDSSLLHQNGFIQKDVTDEFLIR